MFAHSLSARGFKPSTMFSNLYQQVGVETGVSGATPHQLVKMLFDGLVDAIAQARSALLNRDLETKGRAIGKASRILEEGLKAALNPAAGEIAANLSDLYSYVIRRLMEAHLRNDVQALDECRGLIEPVRDAWNTIGAQVSN
jgi:flagellar secretion chaperone FliS